MRLLLSVALVATPALAFAEDGGKTQAPKPEADAVPIIGGTEAGSKWPDAVGVMYGGYQECTGTLIAPNVVITAGHCILGGAPNAVLVGAPALSKAREGETIAVDKAIPYPNSQSTLDVGVLVLKVPSKFEPRKIASGWAKSDIVNGAQVQFVGFGTVDRNGSVATDALMEASSTITDFNCSSSSGCNPLAKPDGELGAGGMGIDTCPGDSGGPMYLVSDMGTFLAGVTSRAYDNARYACGEGGIYGRPDKIVDWIREQTKADIAVAPTPTLDAPQIEAVRGDPDEVHITPNDPKSNSHTYAVKTPPGYARAAVSDEGTVRVCAGELTGMDSMVVTVTDANNSARSVDVTIPILIVDGDLGEDCDETDFGDDGGCCSASRDARGSIILAAFVLLALRRRRR